MSEWLSEALLRFKVVNPPEERQPGGLPAPLIRQITASLNETLLHYTESYSIYCSSYVCSF